MNQELTTEQKARVFAQYTGQRLSNGLVLSGFMKSMFTDTACILFTDEHSINSATAQLLLRPLSAITDEDAIEVAKLWPIWADCTEDLRSFVVDRVKWVMFSANKPQGDMPWIVRDFLIQRGYAVPLFIAPGHPCNGKTAIELGLAIDSTNNETL